MNIELLKAGFLLMIIGMGFVYFFITIMIFAMNINSKILAFIAKFFPEEIEEEQTISSKKRTNNNNDAEIALAIACAYAERGRTC